MWKANYFISLKLQEKIQNMLWFLISLLCLIILGKMIYKVAAVRSLENDISNELDKTNKLNNVKYDEYKRIKNDKSTFNINFVLFIILIILTIIYFKDNPDECQRALKLFGY